MILGKNRALVFSIFILAIFSQYVSAQSSSEIYHHLLKLKETTRILYIAAHPDDENTRLIAYLGNKEHAQVAYLSLTRGDGGQNLIGKELGLELGMIRTQELLKARQTDGGKQFFSRAIDFGFSKNPDETLNNWDKETLLSDVVWIIRSYQPDIIINRFNTEPGVTHGHHTTSALLSIEAFKAAADPAAFPQQLSHVEPWAVKRVFWNGYNWGSPYQPEGGKLYYDFPVGEYNPLLGTTYSQIAADSRTMHKSQGFGATAQIGKGDDYIELVDGEPFKKQPFEGVANRWNTVENGKMTEAAISEVLKEFDFLEPEHNVPQLLHIKSLIDKMEGKAPWIGEKKHQINQIILQSLGIKTEYLADRELSFPSDKINTSLVVNNPSSLAIQVSSFSYGDIEVDVDQVLADNETLTLDLPLELAQDFPVSQPYWIVEPPENNLYQIEDQLSIGKAYNDPAVAGDLIFKIEGQSIHQSLPLTYKYNDPVDGEINQPFKVVPEIQLSLKKENVFVLNNQVQTLEVQVNFADQIIQGELLVEGLSPQEYSLTKQKVDKSKRSITYELQLQNISSMGKQVVGVKYKTADGKLYDKGIKRIHYQHIPNLTYFPASEFNLINLSLELSPQRIGYIPGAGDDIPAVLSNLGYEVVLLENGELTAGTLSRFNTVIVGIRAFNTNTNLANHVDDLMDYVSSGGNLIVQYNTIGPLLTRQIGPYPFELSRDRVAVEDSPVQIDAGSHPILNVPNEIKQSDFDGWVQERGLYFPGQWDDKYTTPFIMKDPGESETRGALLLADYGKGTYTYSGISWFRLLPAGVPGAIKIFVNLIEQGHE